MLQICLNKQFPTTILLKNSKVGPIIEKKGPNQCSLNPYILQLIGFI